MESLISVIIPVYNTESYIGVCLESLVKQTYTNFEVLMIDDGSTDNSGRICQEYTESDSRFHYYRKENGGVSSARNLGIEYSRGDYLTFVDSDDWVEEDFLEVLYSALISESASVSISTYKRFSMEDNTWYVHSFQRGYEKRVFNYLELINELIDLDSFDHSYRFVSGKLVRRDILGDIRFNTLTILGEDMEFWFKIYLISPKSVYINRDSYVYRIAEGPTRHFSLLKIRCDLQQRKNFIALLSARNIDVGRYVDSFVSLLKFRKKELEEKNLSETDTMKWIKETLYLLDE
ncbi:glycosyl transferase 2 family protein [Streptococcus mitis]|uniref:glycosyltransferase family 2 protein n=1 Tax=Streptococcus mitis TaxID=28037 RepID=UPI0004D56C23|nr:glycosyltransferase family 2 protein [Streptococcus mitis]QBZ14028.1 glycosyl transferase 2 family protein [Streptococcus mitis]